MKATVHVMLKNGVLDPQGKAIGHALEALGFEGVGEVRQGKIIELELVTSDKSAAEAEVRQMCQRLLANTVIENFTIDIKE
ncbi:MAG: phosphoribosylformylglycinamidine synthase subunit PurS [Pseudomonadota bacterium]|nr:phosphoribosylformylglycinamidine synthase subunit PurS [Pseudomonadota bacterium]